MAAIHRSFLDILRPMLREATSMGAYARKTSSWEMSTICSFVSQLDSVSSFRDPQPPASASE